MAVSHCWETREHPDPTNYQVQHVCNYTSLHYFTYREPIWLFFDYTSLYQYERQTTEQESSFRSAMCNMHVLYSHESTYTLRVQSLTPQHVWEQHLDKPVHVYDARCGCMKAVPLCELTRNETPYLKRGWCRAELEWSSARSRPVQNQRIDDASEEQDTKLKTKTPTPPNVFQQTMTELEFTHRSDLGPVLELQKKIYLEKAVA